MSAKRQSIQPTYDKRETGERFTLHAYECDQPCESSTLGDPFVTHIVHIRGWRNALKVLFRRYTYQITVGGDHSIIEDIFELDNDYKGERGSTRRAEWDAQLEGSLHDFAAVIAEHEEDEPDV